MSPKGLNDVLQRATNGRLHCFKRRRAIGYEHPSERPRLTRRTGKTSLWAKSVAGRRGAALSHYLGRARAKVACSPRALAVDGVHDRRSLSKR